MAVTATSVYADSDLRPLAAVDIIGSPDAAVTGKLAVGTDTPGNKALTVAGVIDFLGAGTVSNYFTQGPGNNMQIRSNVSETNAIDDVSKSQWNLVMGAAIDQFSIRRSPAGGTYNEDALFFIDGATGDVGIAKVDTSNGATIPFTIQARLHVSTTSGDAIRGISAGGSGIVNGVYGHVTAGSGSTRGVYGQSNSNFGTGVYGWASAPAGFNYGVIGKSQSTSGRGVYGWAAAASGTTYGVYGYSESILGLGVYGEASATTGSTYGVYGLSASTAGQGVYGNVTATNGTTYGVHGLSASTTGRGVYGETNAASGVTYGIYGLSESVSGYGVYGLANANSGTTYGVYGISHSTLGRGVSGLADASSGSTYGVYARSASTGGYGVYGYANASSGSTFGVYGWSASTAGVGTVGYASANSGTNYGVYGQSNSASGYDFYAAGAGTNYGPFTGAHEVRLSESFPLEVKAGMIVSAVGEAQIRYGADGRAEISSTLPTVRLAETAEDKAVLGVLVADVTLPEDHWYPAGESERFASVNALGEGRVWVANINGDIEAGDYITTSALPGYGQLQNDDLLHNYTLGKATETVEWDTVTETVVYEGQEYKVYLLAVVYMSG